MVEARSLGTELITLKGFQNPMNLFWGEEFHMVNLGLAGAVFEGGVGVLALDKVVLDSPIQAGFQQALVVLPSSS